MRPATARRSEPPDDAASDRGPRACADARPRGGRAGRRRPAHVHELHRDRHVPGVRGGHPWHHLLGRAAHAVDQGLLRRRRRHRRFPEWCGHRRRLHVGGELPRHLGAGLHERLRRADLLDRLPGRLADHHVPDGRAAAQPGPLHLRRRGVLPPAGGPDPHAGCGTLVTVAFYLIAQMVGAGQLIELLFGLPYALAVVIVGVLMILYVTFGGMIATTWVQTIKAGLLLFGATMIAVLVLNTVGWDVNELFTRAIAASPKHEAIMRPGGLVSNPISAISLGIALMFGTAGLPHILMRFFTVPDAKEARKSVFWATTFIGYFYILTFIIGFGAIVLVSTNPAFLTPDHKGLIGGTNMPAIHLAAAVGGDAMKGFISAVAFATILAVVSGLTLSGASAVSHDLYASVIRHGNVDEATEVRVSRITTIVLGIVAIILGVIFEKINVAFMVGLAFAVAASANFPVLLLSIMWKGLTTRGAVIGGFVGLISALVLTIVSPGIWEAVFGYPKGSALFPFVSPAIFTIPLSFFCCWVFSVTDSSKAATTEQAAFEAQYVRAQTGIGADVATAH